MPDVQDFCCAYDQSKHVIYCVEHRESGRAALYGGNYGNLGSRLVCGCACVCVGGLQRGVT